MIRKHRTFIVTPGLVLLGLVACSRDAVTPAPDVGTPNFTTCADKQDHCGGGGANFRLTGGGRIDTPEEVFPPSKNTPESHDFATFGFQARPTGPNTVEGSGNFTWVEHNPFAFGGGFTLHGRVATFVPTGDHTGRDGVCGAFSGVARVNTRLGPTFDFEFHVDHACDNGEPGRSNDHIRLIVPDAGYDRGGFLTGGNIQAHKLSGRGA